MESPVGLYAILSAFIVISLILVLSFSMWMIRVGRELKKIKRSLSLLQEDHSRKVPIAATAPANGFSAQVCQQCGKSGKADDLMCVYCHSPFHA